MKPISKKFDERIQKNATKHSQQKIFTNIQEGKHKELVHKEIEQMLKWAFENYQKTTSC